MESSAAEGKARIFRPPTVPEEMWALVPADGRQELLLFVARQLRAGVHPKETVKKFLVESGLMEISVAPTASPVAIRLPSIARRTVQPAVKPATLSRPPAMPTAAAKPSSFRLKPAAAATRVVEVDDDFDFDDDFGLPEFDEDIPVTRPPKPLHPYGLKVTPATNDVPKGHIGHALHRLLGFPGEPGKKAADAEASVLRAIAADPAFAKNYPDQIGNYGCIVPENFLETIKDLIVAEAIQVEGDILNRKENGDPTAQTWGNPADWVDNQ